MGMVLGDYNNDGDLDVYVVNRDGRSVLYRNNVERLQLVDVAAASGTDNLGTGTGCAFGDYDHDGDLDLFVVNWRMPARVFMNQGDGTFVDMATAFGMADTAQINSVMLGDYDSDGDPDVYMINEGGPNRLYQNGGNPRAWLKVDVQGTQSNVDGIGARISMTSGAQVQTREVNGSAGFSLNSRMVHFGLGSSNRIDSLVVRWPSGRVDRYLDMAANSTLLLVEGRGITAVEETDAPLPHSFGLDQNYPNPFNASTLIRFSIAASGPVRLVLYNALGQQIRVLIDEELKPGYRQVVWDGKNDQGRSVASGAYFYHLESGGRERTRSMVLLR